MKKLYLLLILTCFTALQSWAQCGALEPTVTYSEASGDGIVCPGEAVTLNISGDLDGSSAWYIYTGSCGGTLHGSATPGESPTTYNFPAPSTNTAYYVRGEGGVGCATGHCGTVTVLVTAADDASFNYAAASYCKNATTNPSPMGVATPGGTFSSTTGLVFASGAGVANGTIDLAASTAGTYTITYETSGACPTTFTDGVTINEAGASVMFSYDGSPYCQNGTTNPSPTIAAGAEGTFSSGTGSLVAVETSGVIKLSESTAGSYSVTFTPSGACPTTSTAPVSITAADNASFNYAAAAYCKNATTNPSPMSVATPGGTFSSTTGLVFASGAGVANGTIDLAACTAGTYTITYETSGVCQTTSTDGVTITAADIGESFSYADPFCQNVVTDPSPTITDGDATGSSFSSSSADLVFADASNGTIDLSASMAGTYTVMCTTSGACPTTTTDEVIITAADNASFSYSGSPYCQNGATNPTPSITMSGGTFTSDPATGLSINGSTGEINLAASAAGTYTITYETSGSCPSSHSETVTITAADDASFNYAAASYCKNAASNPSPMSVATPGGTFSSTTGLVFVDAGNGTIDLAASTAGTYTITYETSGVCQTTSTDEVTITAVDDASFNYAAASYCKNATTNPSPISVATPGGTFSSTTGLVFASGAGVANGTIDLSASTAGTYTITYETSGACPTTTTDEVIITAADMGESFSYADPFCQNAVTDPSPTITDGDATGSSFSSSSANLVFADASNGRIDLSASMAGTYTVKCTTSGACPTTTTDEVIITAADNASFIYSGSPYCQNATTNPSPISVATPGGTFSSTTGLVFASGAGVANGTIDLAASTAGTYTITYETSGACQTTSTDEVTITAADMGESFSYADPFCQNVVTDPSPTITDGDATGSSFSSSSANLVFADASNGTIDLSASMAGTYTVMCTTSGACPTTTTDEVTITAADMGESFSYADPFCQNAVTDPSPTITDGDATGSSFSSSSANLVFADASNGKIDLSASMAGTYTVMCTTSGACPTTTTDEVTITAADMGESFSYADPFCQNAVTDPSPTITDGDATGSSFSSAGLVFADASNGTIDLSASMAGTYTVMCTTSGACPTTTTDEVTITAADMGESFSYADPFCQNAVTDPSPTITDGDATGSSFSSSSANLVFADASNGTIELSASMAGTYTVMCTTSGACPTTTTDEVIITAADDASFNYSGSPYCQNGATNPTPSITMSGGTFTSDPATGLSINSSTGEINLAASAAGTYTITYTTTGDCPASATQSVTITALTASTSQTDVSCHGGSDGSATVSATGGTGAYAYSWSPSGGTSATAAGLSAGTYTITVTDGNSCTATESVTISQPPAPVFTLVGSAGPSTCGGMDGSIALSARNVADGTHMLQFSHDGQQQSRNLHVSGGNISLEGLGRGLYGQFRLAVGSCNYAVPVGEVELSDPAFTTSASNTGPYEAGEEIQLMAHSGVSFSWSGPNGFYSADQSPSIPSAKESNAGTYRLVARGANGCTDTVSTVVAVNCLPSLGVTYYLAYGDGPAGPEVIAPLVQRLTVQANPARPMTVLAVPDCGTGGVESVRLQMSWWYAGQGYGLDRVDSEPLYTLHKLPYNPQGQVAGGFMGENYYTFTGTAYSADNGGGSKLLGPETVQFFIVGGERAISAPVASKWAFCNGGTFTVDVDSTGSFIGGNQFRVYLSDAAGSFASPRQVGFSKSPKGIACRIPFDVPSGSGYRLRVVSTAPVVASAVSERELSIIGKDLVLASPLDDVLGGAADRRAVETVRASNYIGSGADVTYRAGKHIVLTPGFSVEAGSVFSTGISPQCPENE